MCGGCAGRETSNSILQKLGFILGEVPTASAGSLSTFLGTRETEEGVNIFWEGGRGHICNLLCFVAAIKGGLSKKV